MENEQDARRVVESLVHLYEDGAFPRRELMNAWRGGFFSGAAAVTALEAVTCPSAAAEQEGAASVRVAANAPDIDAKMIEFPGKAGGIFAHLARPKVGGIRPGRRCWSSMRTAG